MNSRNQACPSREPTSFGQYTFCRDDFSAPRIVQTSHRRPNCHIHNPQRLRVIAAELVTQVRKSVTIDWTLRESARARIRVMVKRILNKYGYPPDLQEEAVKTLLMQAELLCAEVGAE